MENEQQKTHHNSHTDHQHHHDDHKKNEEDEQNQSGRSTPLHGNEEAFGAEDLTLTAGDTPFTKAGRVFEEPSSSERIIPFGSFEAVEEDTVEDGEDIKKDNSKEDDETRAHDSEDISSDEWKLHPKHVFLLSWAGRPIYSRYGDESELAGFMGVLQAMISFGDDEGDPLRALITDELDIVFVQKGPIYLVCVSRTKEPLPHLVNQLNYLFLQIISTLTNSVLKTMTRSTRFDIRNLLGGSDRFLDSLVTYMDADPSMMMGGIQSLRMPQPLRRSVGSILESEKRPDLLYSILFSGHKLINMARNKTHILYPSDLHLIMNLVNSSDSFRNTETWTPICLPKFNDGGYLYAHISFVVDDICLLLLSTKSDGFYTIAEAKGRIVSKLEQQRLVSSLRSVSKNDGNYCVADTRIRGLLHFVYMSTAISQITSPAVGVPYLEPQQKQRYLTFGPLTSIAYAYAASTRLISWIGEHQRDIFVTDSPVW